MERGVPLLRWHKQTVEQGGRLGVRVDRWKRKTGSDPGRRCPGSLAVYGLPFRVQPLAARVGFCVGVVDVDVEFAFGIDTAWIDVNVDVWQLDVGVGRLDVDIGCFDIGVDRR